MNARGDGAVVRSVRTILMHLVKAKILYVSVEDLVILVPVDRHNSW